MRLAETTLGPAAKSAWRWWTRELATFVPARLRTAAGRVRPVLEVRVAGQRLSLFLRRGERTRALGELDLPRDEPAAAGPALRDLLRGARGSYDLIVLRVPAERALRRQTRLPLAARESLAEAIGYDMDRQTPFAEEEVYYGAHELGIDRAGGWVDVELEVVRRAEVEPALTALSVAGLQADRLEVAPGGHADLLPPEARPARGQSTRRAIGMLALAALLLAATAIYLPLHQLRGELAAVERRVVAARGAANQVEALRERFAALAEREARLFERKRNDPMALAVLAELTASMPDHTFAILFAYDGDEVTLTGYSDRASALISRLEGTRFLSEATFRSPVTQDQRIGGERYNVAARIERAESKP